MAQTDGSNRRNSYRRTLEHTYVCSHAGPGIDSYYDTALEHKAQCGGSMSWLDAFNYLSLERVNLQGNKQMQLQALDEKLSLL